VKIAFVVNIIQSLGIEYMSAILKKAGYDVRLFVDPQLFNDGTFYFKKLEKIFDFSDWIVREIKNYNPDLIGFSVLTDYYEWASKLAGMLKASMDVQIIFGGMHPTIVPELVIKNKFVDMICIGEGEYPMLELAASMAKGKIDYSIKNLWFKKNGTIIRNDIRPLIENLDSLPLPDKDLYCMASPHFRIHYYITTGRGCPHMCSYCCNSYLHKLFRSKGKFVRLRSPKNILREIEYIVGKYGKKFIFFVDENFGMNLDWLKRFAELYKKQINIPYAAVMHPADVIQEKIGYLKDSGCSFINLGVQAWDENIREKWFNRRVSNETMKKAIRLIQDNKIELMVDNIIDIPGQSIEDLIKSNMVYVRVRPKRLQFFRLRYFPKHGITLKAREEGWITDSFYENVLQGKDYKRFLIESPLGGAGEKQNLRFIQAHKLLLLMDMVPAVVIEFLAARKFYRFFSGNMFMIYMLRRLFYSDTEVHMTRKSILVRYAYFMKDKIIAKFRGVCENSVCQ